MIATVHRGEASFKVLIGYCLSEDLAAAGTCLTSGTRRRSQDGYVFNAVWVG